MYKSINDQLVSNVLKKADEICLNERRSFNVYGEAIEEYIQNHKLILGEDTGIYLITGAPFNVNSYPYVVYSNDAESDGYNIADELYKKTNYKYVQAISQLNGAEIQVKIADRQLVKIIQLEEYKGVDVLALTDPKIYNGWFNKNLLCISVDVQLARIYRQLTSPAFVDKWEALLSDEFKLFKILKDKLKNKSSIINGGKDIILNNHYNEINKELFGGDNEDVIIDGSDENTTVSDENVFVGCDDIDGNLDIAVIISAMNQDSKKKTSGSKEEDIKDFIIKLNGIIISQSRNKIQITNIDAEELEKYLKQKYGDKNIQKIIQLPKVPGDERLRRYTYYLIEKDKRRPIIDLFNIDRYDPIPQKNNYVHPMVIIRMLLVDIWTIKLIAELGNIDKAFAEKRIFEMYSEMIKIREELSDEILTVDVLNILKQGYTYVGIMDKDQYAKSRIIRKNRDQLEVYIPSKNTK